MLFRNSKEKEKEIVVIVVIRDMFRIFFEQFFSSCENEFPMYLLDDMNNRFWLESRLPTRMLNYDRNGRVTIETYAVRGNFFDDFISRHFLEHFIRYKQNVYDVKKLMKFLLNLPTESKFMKLKSEQMEPIEKISSKYETNAKTYSLDLPNTDKFGEATALFMV